MSDNHDDDSSNAAIGLSGEKMKSMSPNEEVARSVFDPWGSSNPAEQQDFIQDIMFTTKDHSSSGQDVDSTERDFHTINSMLNGTSNGYAAFDDFQDEAQILRDNNINDKDKRKRLQKIFLNASSNGDHVKVANMLNNCKEWLELDQHDDVGSTPLIYASCFGHEDVVCLLLEGGASVNIQDRLGWSPLMWATNNNHEEIVKVLLAYGASFETKSARGRTVHDFIAPENIRIQNILHMPSRPSSSTSSVVSSKSNEDWYQPAGNQEEQFQSALAENELKRRMLMESAFNLEVDLASLAIDDELEEFEEIYEEFVWDKCLPNQMFVFSISDLPHILETAITKMQPIRSRAQKPVPANLLFLACRFAHYFSTPELLENLLYGTVDRIDRAVKMRADDMTLHAFWISNCMLLLYYLKKDYGLVIATADYQVRISELINEIYVLLIRDAERRIDRVMDAAILDHETIPGFEDVRFEGEWKLIRTFTKRGSPSLGGAASKVDRRRSTSFLPSSLRPPSPRRNPNPSPRTLTSILSSMLFVLQTYEIHPAIIEQSISQVFYWMACELFNRLLTRKKYLCRSKAMQIRLNVSSLEDWARVNRLSAKRVVGVHVAPLLQLLQWLQCFSQLQDFTELIATVQTLNSLNPAQMLRAVRDYRYEVNEEKFPPDNEQYLMQLQVDYEKRQTILLQKRRKEDFSANDDVNINAFNNNLGEMKDSRYMLPFALPTSAEMLVVSAQVPMQPPDGFLEKLDSNKQNNGKTRNSIVDTFDEEEEDEEKDASKDMEENQDDMVTPRLGGGAEKSPWA